MSFEGPARAIKTVSEINREINDHLENQFRFVRVSGEISNVRRPFSGHCYFILKDHAAQISAILFKNQQRFLARELEEGLQVICDGRITVYQPRGHYQLIVDTVDFHGVGRLQLDFERLKQKLRSEGYFATERKKPIPAHINKVVLITSPSGAAVHDFLTICRKRKADMLVQILPVRVQGKGAAEEIASGVLTARTLAPDVIVLCRGGGSIEDLWAFNEQCVAQAIFDSNIPIITGIGHETDFTIADFCADARGSTPTGAAELLLSDASVFKNLIESLLTRLLRSFHWRLDSVSRRLERINGILATFDTSFNQPTLRLDVATSRFISVFSRSVQNKINRFDKQKSRLLAHSPVHALHCQEQRIEFLRHKLTHNALHHFAVKQSDWQKAVAVLDSLSPLATLARGFAVVSKKTEKTEIGTVITSINQVTEQEQVEIRLHHGILDCIVAARRP